MEVLELSASRPGLVLLFALLCGVRRFTKANPTAPCEWDTPRLGYDSMALNCTGLGLKIRPSDSSAYSLALDLSFNGQTGIRRSDFLPRSPSITKVNLSHRCVVEVQGAAFAGFSNLEELDLSNNCLRGVRDGTLKGLGRLKTLDLRHNRISEVHRYAFTGLDAVQTVWLQNNKLDTIPEAIGGLSDLGVLSLAHNHISRVDSRSFHGCRSLTALHLQHNRISVVSVDAFEGLLNLQMLNLGTNLLETMPGSSLKSLWARGTDVRLRGNPWRCGAPGWLRGRIRRYGGPLHGAPLSSPSPGQLGCRRTPRLSQTLTADIAEGTDLRLPCGNSSDGGRAQYWHTPFGRLENSSLQGSGEPVAMLRDGSIKIARTTPYHAGLYYCLWAAREDRVIQPYRVKWAHRAVSGGARLRKTREANGDQETVSDDHFVAAVVSAVLVTFLAGFALGAFSRTYLSECFQRLRRRRQQQQRRNSGGVDMATLPWQYENNTFQKGGGPEDSSSSEAVPSASAPPGDAHSRRVPTEASANLGVAYMEGSGSSRESQGEEEAQTGAAARGGGGGGPSTRSAREPQSNDREVSAEETDPASERGAARTSKRRVIKVYNYDDEGNKYGHVRDSQDESAPGMKQRSLSLTRLNAIMASATATGFSREPSQGDTVEQTDPGDSAPIFNLSI